MAEKGPAKKAVAKNPAAARQPPPAATASRKARVSRAVRDGSGSSRQYSLGADVDLDREVVRDSRGRRITTARAEAAAVDAVAKAGRGRPSLSGEAGVGSPQVTFRLSAKLREKAERRAAAEGKNVSEVAREALERYLG